MQPEGPVTVTSAECERVLRTLPRWFGVEEWLLEYARNAERFPTFVVRDSSPSLQSVPCEPALRNRVVAFLTLQQHFDQAWELHCIAVDAEYRHQRIGRALHEFAEAWLVSQGAKLLQVKTLAESHPSREYAETRKFYERLGYVPLEIFPELWAPHLPVLQMVKALGT